MRQVHWHNVSTKLQRIEGLILDLLLSYLESPVLGKVSPVLRFTVVIPQHQGYIGEGD
jgi:hypothetical protein